MQYERLRNRLNKRTSLRTIVTALLLITTAALTGCTSSGPTKPNQPYEGVYPPFFLELQEQNSLLAEEITKLPELSDGIQDKESAALRILCEAYNSRSDLFNDVFIKMYNTGLPNTRKYCSPLQALFWIAREGNTKKVIELMSNYSLNHLLSQAWRFEPPPLSDEEIAEVIADISDTKIKAQYLIDINTSSNQQIQHFLLIDYRLNRDLFSKKSELLLDSKKSKKHPDWGNFDTVVERLNSPELVDYFEQNQFQWVDWRTLPTWPVSTRYVFKKGKGDCTVIADFTALCLNRAGYKAYEYKVAPTRPVDAHHSICVFYADNAKYVMDNGRPLKRGILPYDEY